MIKTNREFQTVLREQMNIVAQKGLTGHVYYICHHLAKKEPEIPFGPDYGIRRSFSVQMPNYVLTITKTPFGVSVLGEEIAPGDQVEIDKVSYRSTVTVDGKIVLQFTEVDPARVTGIQVIDRAPCHSAGHGGHFVEVFLEGEWSHNFSFEAVGRRVAELAQIAQQEEDNRPLTEEQGRIAANFGIEVEPEGSEDTTRFGGKPEGSIFFV